MEFLAGFAPFLDIKYWFNARPVPLGPSLVGGIFAFFGWFMIATIILRVIAYGLKRQDSLKSGIFRRIASLLATTGLLGLMFLFFSYEQLPFLGMRFWFLFLFLGFTAWLLRIAMYVVRDYPSLKNERAEQQRLRRYLPKGR